MSKARDEYRKFIVDHAWEWEDEPVLNYVVELEAEKAELLEFIENISTKNISPLFVYERAVYLYKKYYIGE